ncbi:MarR family winged helix-turn-helix transcriptional regulator [Modestobacter sp. L9-4]|uniref:MarR family winged helix-turn-helix transcriptional regulator n=1 Tax=Modestobacter sp. L9-4 TaxID=2851567 RepID=UPI001C756C52|nr:MarR family winged helix-turn-helix transcriptional regulator [Modestobacter sp. L9-4]QXG75255.1 MarR family winged helix-turn-helix transcriptional regulator [Modestobacter sp. L9-4]
MVGAQADPAPEPPEWVPRGPDHLPAYVLARAGTAVDDLFARHLGAVGLRPHTFVVLVHLVRAGTEPLTSAELARRLQMTPQSMGALLHGLVEAGWVERAGEVRRGQRVDVRVTPAGREALDSATPALAHLSRPETLGLTAEEAGTLHGLLQRVLTAIAADPGPGA